MARMEMDDNTIPTGTCRYCLHPEHPSGTMCSMHPALLKERMEPYAFTGEPLEKCQLCGEPMPQGEEMFNYHGYSGPCPKPPLPKAPTIEGRMRELLSGYRVSRIGHEECRDLTGHPDALPSQRKDWRCDLCKQADELAQSSEAKNG